jgi:hypothetical protein
MKKDLLLVKTFVTQEKTRKHLAVTHDAATTTGKHLAITHDAATTTRKHLAITHDAATTTRTLSIWLLNMMLQQHIHVNLF